ncbi:MAG: host-nuclease inhibitor Gam family protein [Candidatus Lernaella stagnicola]|nr:host-nuclease inhibitor Gam family protein [Candidatus Lernaella stagnicola]
MPRNEPVDLPADPKDWTEAHLDEALRRITYYEIANARDRLKYDDRMAKAKADYDLVAKDRRAAIKLLIADLKKAATRLRKNWRGKTLQIAWGRLWFHLKPRKLRLARGCSTEEAILALEELGVENAVRVEKSVNLEVLERCQADVIKAAGFEWTKPREQFEYKTKLTLDVEQAGGKP